ncbi:MAG: hypothetical protein K0V04_24895 [Deltaproteobacteria bacterium]|nr:hypothetical protein [Deltaproteobacteria bacterium]
MKLIGIESIEGGVAVALPSGQQVLMALPHDEQRSALLVGQKILAVLADPDQPHAKRGESPLHETSEAEDDLASIEAGIEVGHLLWGVLKSLRKG